MTGTPNRPPLWREIDCAWWSLVDTANPHAAPPENDQAACVIRAVAKWLLPEEEPLPDSVHGGNRAARQAERQRLRALLTEGESDRARKRLWKELTATVKPLPSGEVEQ